MEPVLALWLSTGITWWCTTYTQLVISRCLLQTHQVPLHPLLNTNVSAAPLALHARYLTAMLHLVTTNTHLTRSTSKCQLRDVVSEAVWFKQLSVWVPVLLASPWHGPISSTAVDSSEGVRWWHVARGTPADNDYIAKAVLQHQQPVLVVNHHALPAALVLVTAQYANELSGASLPAPLRSSLKLPQTPLALAPPALPSWVHRVWQERAAAKKQKQQQRQGGPPAQPIIKVDPGKGLSQLGGVAKAPKETALLDELKGVASQVRQLEAAVQRRSETLTKQQWPIEADVKQASDKFFARAQPASVSACFKQLLQLKSDLLRLLE